LTADGAKTGVSFGGLAYGEASGTDGPVVLISAAGSPPVIYSSGTFPAKGPILNDLVIDPAEWTGAGLPSTLVNRASLQAVMRGGTLPALPTFAQWEGGAAVRGWDLKKNSMTLVSQNLQWFGWAYPGITTPGACY
jgi:hypothetical protein